MSKWTEEKINEAFDKFHEKTGKWPRQVDLGTKNKLPSNSPINKLYGGITAYYISRDITPNKGGKCTEEDLDKKVLAFLFKYNRYPKQDEFSPKHNLPSISAVYRLFGTLGSYYKDRNYELNKFFHTKESILVKLNEKIKELGRFPTQHMLEEYSKLDAQFPSSSTIVRHLGSLEHAAELCNSIPNLIQIHTSESIIYEISEKVKELGRMLTYEDITNFSKESVYFPSYPTVMKKFNSLTNLAEKLELNPIISFYTKDSVRDKVKEKAKELKRMLTFEDIMHFSKKSPYFPSWFTVNKYFSLKELATEINMPYIGDNYCKSKGEQEVLDFIKELTKEEIIKNDRKILHGKEIDIFIPALNIGIEYNGNYWHSYNNTRSPKDKNYHTYKTKEAMNSNILLCHIFESEWLEQREKIKQYLIQFIKNDIIEYNGEIGSKIKLDNRFPLRYSNLKILEGIAPQLIILGNHSIWDCGTTVYEVI